jgi:hypothetical protein
LFYFFHLYLNFKRFNLINFRQSLDYTLEKGHQELFKSNRDLYNLINYFLYNPNTSIDENGIPKFGWPKINDLKIGWQFPNNLLIDWCKENFDNKNETEIKYPFQFTILKKIRPKKPIKGKIVTTFENVVDIFKTEIQFRDNYLYKELNKRQRKMADYEFIGIENFKSLDFYTYTSGFLSSIDVILNEIKRNETEKKIVFSYREIKDHLIIDITHLNSFPTRNLIKNDLSRFLGGGLYAISGSIFSLCDFSVISKFEDSEKNIINGELKIVYDSIKGSWSKKDTTIRSNPVFAEYKDDIKGFTYRFKFYL